MFLSSQHLLLLKLSLCPTLLGPPKWYAHKGLSKGLGVPVMTELTEPFNNIRHDCLPFIGDEMEMFE